MSITEWPYGNTFLHPGFDDNWFSWTGAMEPILLRDDMNSVLELGVGFGTKKLLAMKGLQKLWSVEVEREWLERCDEGDPRQSCHHALYGEAEFVRRMSGRAQTFDVALVDGITGDRPSTVWWLMKNRRAKVILAHDFSPSDVEVYGWDMIKLPHDPQANWHVLRFVGLPGPHTGIFVYTTQLYLELLQSFGPDKVVDITGEWE